MQDAASDDTTAVAAATTAMAAVARDARCVLDEVRRTHTLAQLARVLPAVLHTFDMQQQSTTTAAAAATASSSTTARHGDDDDDNSDKSSRHQFHGAVSHGVVVCAMLAGALCRRTSHLLQLQNEQQQQQQQYAAAEAALATSLLDDAPLTAAHLATMTATTAAMHSDDGDALRMAWQMMHTLHDRLVDLGSHHTQQSDAEAAAATTTQAKTTTTRATMTRRERKAAARRLPSLAYSLAEVCECRRRVRAHARRRLRDVTVGTLHWDIAAVVAAVTLTSELACTAASCEHADDKVDNMRDGDACVSFRTHRRGHDCYACTLDAQQQQQQQQQQRQQSDDSNSSNTLHVTTAALSTTRVLTPLRDALTRRAVVTPARGAHCSHLDVFDLTTFVYAAQQQHQRSGRRVAQQQQQEQQQHLYAATRQTRCNSNNNGDDDVDGVYMPGASCPLCGCHIALDEVRIDGAAQAAMRAYTAAMTLSSSSSFAQPLSAQHMLEWDLVAQTVRVVDGNAAGGSNSSGGSGAGNTRRKRTQRDEGDEDDDDDLAGTTYAPLLVDNDDDDGDDDDERASRDTATTRRVTRAHVGDVAVSDDAATASPAVLPVARKRRVEVGGHVLYLDEV